MKIFLICLTILSTMASAGSISSGHANPRYGFFSWLFGSSTPRVSIAGDFTDKALVELWIAELRQLPPVASDVLTFTKRAEGLIISPSNRAGALSVAIQSYAYYLRGVESCRIARARDSHACIEYHGGTDEMYVSQGYARKTWLGFGSWTYWSETTTIPGSAGEREDRLQNMTEAAKKFYTVLMENFPELQVSKLSIDDLAELIGGLQKTTDLTEQPTGVSAYGLRSPP